MPVALGPFSLFTWYNGAVESVLCRAMPYMTAVCLSLTPLRGSLAPFPPLRTACLWAAGVRMVYTGCMWLYERVRMGRKPCARHAQCGKAAVVLVAQAGAGVRCSMSAVAERMSCLGVC